jgi:hypothetical protein
MFAEIRGIALDKLSLNNTGPVACNTSAGALALT